MDMNVGQIVTGQKVTDRKSHDKNSQEKVTDKKSQMTFFDKQDKNSLTRSHGQKVTGQKVRQIYGLGKVTQARKNTNLVGLGNVKEIKWFYTLK